MCYILIRKDNSVCLKGKWLLRHPFIYQWIFEIGFQVEKLGKKYKKRKTSEFSNKEFEPIFCWIKLVKHPVVI